METEISVTTKLEITGVESLDPVFVYLEDMGPSKGMITIGCWGKTWSSFWPAMGKRSIAQFFSECGEDYLISNLCSGIAYEEPDYEAFQKDVRKYVVESRKKGFMSRSMARSLYDIENWEDYAPQHTYDVFKCPEHESEKEFKSLDLDISLTIPTKISSEYAYMARIVNAVKDGLKAAGLTKKVRA